MKFSSAFANALRCLMSFLILTFLLCALSSCTYSGNKQAALNKMFASFPQTNQYVLLTGKTLCVGDKQTPLDQITYDGKLCNPIVCLENGLYAYAYDTQAPAEVDILLVPYDTLVPTLIDSISVPDTVIAAEFNNDCLYFRIDDPDTEEFHQFYFIYDILTGETSTEEFDALPRLESSCDHNRSEKYELANRLSLSNHFEIKDKQSGETRQITKDVLNGCKEGRAILDTSAPLGITDIRPSYEKDGIIYLTGYVLDDGFLGNPCHAFILKYDFENENTVFYTSISLDAYSDICDLYIP